MDNLMENLNTFLGRKRFIKFEIQADFRLFMRVSFFTGFSICKSHSAY